MVGHNYYKILNLDNKMYGCILLCDDLGYEPSFVKDIYDGSFSSLTEVTNYCKNYVSWDDDNNWCSLFYEYMNK